MRDVNHCLGVVLVLRMIQVMTQYYRYVIYSIGYINRGIQMALHLLGRQFLLSFKRFRISLLS